MMAGPSNGMRPPLFSWRVRVGAILAVFSLLMILAAAWGYYIYYPQQLGPDQPIHFSHRVHVTDKHLSCVFCHTGAIDSAHAGIPPLQTCMLCHQKIIIEYPQIQILRAHYEQQVPVAWEKVNDLPDFVYFNHQVHLRRSIDCGKCHGDIAVMDRVKLVHPFQMGFCVTCHKENGASHDCYTCHR
jgi:hypothetical protein